ncbi:MAG TPA: glutamate--tRNA ligase family protein, partial [Victivallales bacterium]|nr:glutamate--tRNA ligase family protein [Victivallales bacterium]
MNKPRVRFAPSPTGNVHIGNIRVAIFNWLFARHEGGEFLLRVEDTDRERSTDSAVKALLDAMAWLGLDNDGEIVFQSKCLQDHMKAATMLVDSGKAVKKILAGDDRQPVIFILPYDCTNIPFVRTRAQMELNLSIGKELCVNRTGAMFFTSENGREIEKSSSLAGLYGLKIFNAKGETIFDLDAEKSKIDSGNFEFRSVDGTKIKYFSREVFFKDHVKGELSKPLDSMKDFVIVRSDGSPVFHLANVCDDIAQDVNFIIRGDDHVENTFRHIFLFHALGKTPPRYAHLPMIVNQAGKP